MHGFLYLCVMSSSFKNSSDWSSSRQQHQYTQTYDDMYYGKCISSRGNNVKVKVSCEDIVSIPDVPCMYTHLSTNKQQEQQEHTI